MSSLLQQLVGLAIESQEVIFLRGMELAEGGPRAAAEARRMVSEKLVAAGDAAFALMSGAAADEVVKSYRRKVRANIRRLSKRR